MLKIKNVALLGATGYASYKKFEQYAFKQIFNKRDIPYTLQSQYVNWFINCNRTSVNIKAYDGIKLHGVKIENNNTNNYIIIVHGIYCDLQWSIPNAYEFDKLGYNILLIDQRCAGESEGAYYTYGLKESFDLIEWTNYLLTNNPQANIIYYGISMGAATCMMTTKNKLPENVKCIIEDCGYSSFKSELAAVIKKRFKLFKPNILLNMFENDIYDKYGFKYEDIEPANALVNNEIPLLIIHGEDDDFVPFVMSKIVYNKQKGYKKYYPVKNAKHAEAMLNKNYYLHINNFIRTFVE